MKKITILTLALIMCFNLCACENDEKSDNKKDDDVSVSETKSYSSKSSKSYTEAEYGDIEDKVRLDMLSLIAPRLPDYVSALDMYNANGLPPKISRDGEGWVVTGNLSAPDVNDTRTYFISYTLYYDKYGNLLKDKCNARLPF